MKKIKKRGQQMMGMPFGMIFSIILIVVFVVIAFIAVGSFLDIGKSAGVGLFYTELQDAVDNSWRGQSSETTFKINLPSEIKTICFSNLSSKINGEQEYYDQIKNYDVYEANTFLIPPENAQQMQWKLIKHLDIEKITVEENPYCVSTSQNLKLKKGFYDKLVSIE
jgi:hypothetical protein